MSFKNNLTLHEQCVHTTFRQSVPTRNPRLQFHDLAYKAHAVPVLLIASDGIFRAFQLKLRRGKILKLHIAIMGMGGRTWKFLQYNEADPKPSRGSILLKQSFAMGLYGRPGEFQPFEKVVAAVKYPKSGTRIVDVFKDFQTETSH